MQKEFYVDNLRVVVCEDRAELGRVAAADAGRYLLELQARGQKINTIFAAAPSQNEFLDELAGFKDIRWQNVRAFHMDEYIGLAEDAPQRFARFLEEHMFSRVPLKEIHYLKCEQDNAMENYAQLLRKYPTDACFMGVGENGHIAFNDPDVADMFDLHVIKEVSLDLMCRTQQVNDGCFASLDQVPKTAVTLTVPTLLRSKRLFCMVPGKTKANAIQAMLCDPIDMACPASVLRLHKHATLYLDQDSAAYVK